ncbi:MAG TPA: hypothetical protein VFI09_08180 [Solirubrobacterales bacterium]|nr:hypothetical protein [Solirubrobacterales bacterium]
MTTIDRRKLLDDLLRQLPSLSPRGQARTRRAIRQLESELAPGRARATEALRRLGERAER